jgi:hypothetical protein
MQGLLEGLVIVFTIEEDFHGWLLDQAAALRARDYESLDCDHLAQELELMGARERRELRSEFKILLLHLLKLKYRSLIARWRSLCARRRRANRSPTSSRIRRASSKVSVTKCSLMCTRAHVIKQHVNRGSL